MNEVTRSEPDTRQHRAARLRRFIRSNAPGVSKAARALSTSPPAQGVSRVQERMIFALQAGLAAGLALLIANWIGNHPDPFFAPMAAIISLGVSGGRRLRRTFELALGVAVGIAIGDFVVSQIGDGFWQVGVVVFLAIVVATFVDREASVAIQAANTGVLIGTILPPGTTGTWDRMIDALIGGLVGIFVMAVIPNSPLKPVRRVMSQILSKAALVLDDVARGIDEKDPEAIQDALNIARSTQGSVNTLNVRADGGAEMIAVSPIYWNARRHNRSLMRSLDPVDNIMRNTRVLARRAEVMIADRINPDPALHELLHELANELGHLGSLFATGGTRGSREDAVEMPEIARNLQRIAARTTLDVAEGTGISGTVVLAQMRSVIVDTLMVCGFSRESAMASLAPTVEEPSIEPEVRD